MFIRENDTQNVEILRDIQAAIFGGNFNLFFVFHQSTEIDLQHILQLWHEFWLVFFSIHGETEPTKKVFDYMTRE